MNLNPKRIHWIIIGSIYIKLWDVAVVQPVRESNHVGVRITVLAGQMVVINLPFLIGYQICHYPVVKKLLTVLRYDSKTVEKNFLEYPVQ